MMVARTRTVVSTAPRAVRRCPGSAVSRITPGHWGGPGARAARRTGGEVRHLVDTGAIVSTYVGPEDRDEPYLDPGRRSVHRRQDPGRGGRSLKDPVEARLRPVVRDGSLSASSGQVQRHRLNRGGNRQLNWALHYIALVQCRITPGSSGLHGAEAGGGQVPQGGHALPEAATFEPGLPSPRRRREEGGAGGLTT